MIELLEKRNADAKKRVQDLDNEWDRTVQEHNEREEILKEQLRREKERGDRLDANLTRFIEGSEGAMPVGASSASPEPNSGASIVASFMKGTKLSDIFDENRRVKEELQKVKVENVRLTDTTTQLISKVQEMVSQTEISDTAFPHRILFRLLNSTSSASSTNGKSQKQFIFLNNYR